MTVRVLIVASVLLMLNACAQFTTNATDRADLQAAAGKTGEDYVKCIIDASDRYQQTGDSAGLIVELSKKACTTARTTFVDADSALLKTQYMMPEPILKTDLAALDERATTQVQDRVLERRAASPPVAAPAVIAPVASVPASSVPADGSAYLKCMSAEGQRYAGVNEPAEVVAEVAQSRCSALLTDAATATQLEKQGRALVMGMVLDRKVSGP